MRITVNGKAREMGSPITVEGLLRELGIKPGSVAVERNFHIIPRSGFAGEPVEEGDAIEIIKLVGGG